MFAVESQGAVDVVKPNATLNQENAEELTETVQNGLSGGQPMVVVDLSETPLIDSAGLESLLDAYDLVRTKGGTLKLSSATPLCQEILRITAVGERFEQYADVKTAVGSFVR